MKVNACFITSSKSEVRCPMKARLHRWYHFPFCYSIKHFNLITTCEGMSWQKFKSEIFIMFNWKTNTCHSSTLLSKNHHQWRSLLLLFLFFVMIQLQNLYFSIICHNTYRFSLNRWDVNGLGYNNLVSFLMGGHKILHLNWKSNEKLYWARIFTGDGKFVLILLSQLLLKPFNNGSNKLHLDLRVVQYLCLRW